MRIVCFGSLNVDLALRVPHHPAPDETLHAHGIEWFLGGKGANQAVAAARLGAEVAMVGSVGNDAQGDALVDGLVRNGVDTDHLQRVDVSTGMAVPIVTDDGQVSIIVAAGANAKSDAALAERASGLLRAADVLLTQGEVPGAGAGRAAAIARAAGATVIFNPAPVNDVVDHVLDQASVVIANRVEVAAVERRLTGQDLVVTLGADGAMANGLVVAGFDATVVDPTGAGDSFAGAFAVAAGEGLSLEETVMFANAAGSCAVEVPGAEPSMPTREQVLARLKT